MKNLRTAVLFLLLFPFNLFAGTLLDKANIAFDSKDFKIALNLYEKVLQKDKNNLNVIVWASTAAGMMKSYTKQVILLRSLVELDPKRLEGRQLLIRALEQAEKSNESEVEVKKLVTLWQSKPEDIKKKERYFIRDNFNAGEYRVATLQYYELKGQMAKRYHFLAQKKKDELPFVISFGSYPALTIIERQIGTIKANEKIWHLDGYTGKQHYTYGFFETEISYQEVKKMGVKLFKLDNPEKKSISGSDFVGGLIP